MAVDKFGNPISDQYRNIPEEYMQGFRDSEFNKPVAGGMAVTNITLPSGQTVQFGDTGSAAQFRNYLASINVVPQPETGIAQVGDMSSGTIIPKPPQPPTGPGTADPSQFIQGQVGAAVRQPTLPTGTSIGQQLQLQQESPAQLPKVEESSSGQIIYWKKI